MSDPYVGQMKARFLSLVPGGFPVTFVDISHDLPRGSVESAAWALANSLEHIPPGSVLLAVVDPGVGTSRAALACSSSSGVLITGPDNGIFSWLDIASAAALPESAGDVSSTFHGRDVFAVAAARLAIEGQSYIDSLLALSPESDLVTLERPVRRPGRSGAECQVAAIDHFGNVVLWLEAPAGSITPPDGVVALPSGERMPYSSASTYRGGGGGGAGLLLLRGSQGFYELAIDNGRAASTTGLEPGDPVVLTWSGESPGKVP
jgi:S-adenosylmethionine hydrolase